MTRTRAAGAALAAIALLSACGSSGGGGEADKSAAQVLADAENALRTAKSFHIAVKSSGTGSDALGIDIDLVAGGTARGTVTTEGVTASIVVIGGKFYLQGKSFWSHFAGEQAAAVIGDRWAILPSSADTAQFESYINADTFATCLDLDHGTLEKGGTETYNGKQAVVVVDKGDKPGTSPGKLFVSAAAPHYPLGLLVTGQSRPGTPPGGDKCNGGGSSSGSGDTSSSSSFVNGLGSFSLTDYNKVTAVTPPPNPLDLQAAAGGGG